MKPLRPPTHRAIPFATLSKLGASIEEVAVDGSVDFESLLDLAAELGVGCERLLAALPNVDVELRANKPIRFEVCVGGCQEWGALEIAERLANALEARIDDDGVLFDIVPRACLERCQSAAAVIVATPDGRAFLGAATAAAIDEALETV